MRNVLTGRTDLAA
jgi:putative Mg2+ transporter-C (MgtC) family protein